MGTLRYLAPEVLDGHIDVHNLQESLARIDVYAMALVMWEVGWRCVLGGTFSFLNSVIVTSCVKISDMFTHKHRTRVFKTFNFALLFDTSNSGLPCLNVYLKL